MYLYRIKDAACLDDSRPDYASMHPFERPSLLRVDDIDVKMVDQKFRKETAALKDQFKGKTDCLIPGTLIVRGNLGKWSPELRKLTRQILANIQHYGVIHKPGSIPVLGTPSTVVWEKNVNNPSVFDFAGDFSQGLNQDLLQHIIRIEEKLWQEWS